MPTTLSGGQLGYLALVLTEEQYDSIPNSSPLIRPENHGDFQLQVPDPNTTKTPTSRHTTPRSSTRLAANRATTTQDTTALVTTDQGSASVITAAEVVAQKAAHDNDMKKFLLYFRCGWIIIE